MAGIPEVKRTELDENLIRDFSSEEDFMEISVSLMIEAGSYVSVVGCILPINTQAWDSNQAVLGGHLVRLYKLISAMLDQTCQRRREISFILARIAFECIINLSFLLKNYSSDLLLSYKSYSLQHEKRLMDKIKENIRKRNDKTLPIEERMLRSINRAFTASGVNPEDISTNELRNWGNKNIYEKATNVGLGESYLSMFGGGSHNIHGNWQDLLDYHLEEKSDNHFSPKFEWRNPRPQILNVLAIQTAEVLKRYIEWLQYEELNEMIRTLVEFQERVLTLDSAHEKWLSHKSQHE
ncbi:MAG: hypothetical protein NPIRA05_18660 [Nitrospirales bacterium]|nr:MAG: hypothetical protein NPIRA05_18660 [Nitrospirales bacterium]